MKKLLPIVLLLCFALTLMSCAGQTPQTPETTAPQTGTEETSAPDASLPEETTPEETEPEETAPEETAEPPEETETELKEPATIALVWADDWEDDVADLTACTVDEDPRTAFVICPDDTVTEFEIISLYEPEFTDEGPIRFSYTVLYSHGTLLPEAPLLVHTTFYGDIPNIGIRYKDADGEMKMYAIDVSGMDGSLYLSEFVSGGMA